jgi:4-amino-4-deoxy-L-arabinose transferase-like glycosyltransferase
VLNPTHRAVTSTLVGVVGLGALLRLYPVWFGLPYLNARPDESVALGHAVAVMRGDFNPHFFHWPSLTFYLFAAALTLVSDVYGAVVRGGSLGDAGYFIVGRTVVALAGAATIAVLFYLGRRIADARTGLAAATLLAVAVLHVRESHFAMTDVLMTLLVTGSLALLVRALDDTASGPAASVWFAAAGFAGGLAASTKYSAAAVIAAMAAVQLVWFVRSPGRVVDSRSWLPSAMFIVAFASGFLLATPYAILDSRAFATDLRFDFTHLSAGHAVNLGRGWLYHPTRSLPYGIGLPTCIAAVAGVIPMVRLYGSRGVAVTAFALAFYVSLGSGLTVFFRYVLPLVPVVCLFAAVAVRLAADRLASRTRLSAGAAMTMFTGLLAIWPLVNSVWFDVLLARTDTRAIAGEWLRARVKPDDALHEAGGVYAALDLSGASFHRWSFEPATGSFGDTDGRTPEWLVFEESPLWTYASIAPELRRLAVDRYNVVREVIATDGTEGVYDLQDAFFMPVAGFSSVERPGPTVRIYRRRDLPAVDP